MLRSLRWRFLSSTKRCLSTTSARKSLLTLSRVEGAKVPPLNESTLTGYFDSELLSKLASRPALISKKERPRAHAGPLQSNLGRSDCLSWSFEEFGRHIDALAYGLRDMGVKEGDRVGVVMGNNSAYATLQWACAKIGAILVTINPAYRVHELIGTLRLVGVSTLVVVPSIRTSHYVTALAEAIPGLATCHPGEISVEDLPDLRNIVVVDNTLGSDEFRNLLQNVRCTVDFREIFEWHESAAERRAVEEFQRTATNSDVINLQFTSGTTGMPKAVSLTHRNLLNNGNVPPLFHCFDKCLYYLLVLGNLAAWTHGSCIVYPSEIFDAPSIVDAVLQEQCTALHGVPTHFLGVLSEVEKRRAMGEMLDIRRLRTGIAAGSPVPIELMQRLIRELNMTELTVAYGMTETSPVSFQTMPDDPLVKRTETVGRIQPHVKAKLIDLEGNVVPVGTPGEICVSGYSLQRGYWQDKDQTKSVMKIHTGEPETVWMHTGDIGIMDTEGYLRIVGRNKDIIIRGGENLFPVQIENRMTFHPAIREAAAVSVPDRKYGEVVGAWINAPTWVWFMSEEGAPAALPKTASVAEKWIDEDGLVHSRAFSKKPYACSKCGRKYARKGGLALHQQEHEAPKYKCPHSGCDHASIRQSGLLFHMETVHITESVRPRVEAYRRAMERIHREMETHGYNHWHNMTGSSSGLTLLREEGLQHEAKPARPACGSEVGMVDHRDMGAANLDHKSAGVRMMKAAAPPCQEGPARLTTPFPHNHLSSFAPATPNSANRPTLPGVREILAQTSEQPIHQHTSNSVTSIPPLKLPPAMMRNDVRRNVPKPGPSSTS
ncbi:acetyl-CoA synthetase-like protein [Sanghuangporus baumii]|uniref:Acetyl-CoA synthetase-like protein n=1 Tax=Sanghuangporus baumii TaxID=108892 RepID=A0A9Q5HZW9_SANBA|nr:acetyl-CoA synthetase-like protein [Sanghuangporus baumii]